MYYIKRTTVIDIHITYKYRDIDTICEVTAVENYKQVLISKKMWKKLKEYAAKKEMKMRTVVEKALTEMFKREGFPVDES
mgnify:CR=1 FL=1